MNLEIRSNGKKLRFIALDNEEKKWHACFNDHDLFIEQDDNGIYHLSYPSDIDLEEERENIDSFIIQIDKINEDNHLSRIDGIEESEEQTEEKQSEKNPYDPEKIRVETKSFSIAQAFDMMTNQDEEIDLSPDFQRNFVWSDNKRKSRLIESILLRIPLPVFYFSQLEDGKMQVIDGVQRLTVIKDFLSGKFKLSKLEYLEKFNGKYFPSQNRTKEEILEPKFVRRIQLTQLTINIIDPTTPGKVKYDIFKRVNSGGRHLNPQEIRNCMAIPEARKFIKKLAHSEEFKKATCNSVNDIRMAAQKLVMRFIGFYYLKIKEKRDLKYSSDIEDFLNKTLEIFNRSNISEKEVISKDFRYAMTNAHYLFKEHAFRKVLPANINQRRQLINKSLFTTWSVFLSQHAPSKIKNDFKKGALLDPLAKELSKKEDYYNAVSLGTNSKKKLDNAFKKTEEIFNQSKRVLS